MCFTILNILPFELITNQCPLYARTAYAIGMAEVYLVCGEGNVSCSDEDDMGGSANGLVTVG